MCARLRMGADAGIGATERRAHRRLLGRTTGKALADHGTGAVEHFAHAQARFAIAVRIGGGKQVVVEERVDRMRRRRLALGTQVQQCDCKGSQREHAAQRQQPVSARAPRGHLCALASRDRGGGLLAGAPTCTFRQRAQAAGEFGGVAEPARRIDIGDQRDILAQQFIVDVALPARRERATEIADQDLVQHA